MELYYQQLASSVAMRENSKALRQKLSELEGEKRPSPEDLYAVYPPYYNLCDKGFIDAVNDALLERQHQAQQCSENSEQDIRAVETFFKALADRQPFTTWFWPFSRVPFKPEKVSMFKAQSAHILNLNQQLKIRHNEVHQSKIAR